MFFLLVELTSGEGSAQNSADHIHVFKSYTCVFFFLLLDRHSAVGSAVYHSLSKAIPRRNL